MPTAQGSIIMRNHHRRVVGTLLAATVAVTSTTICSGPAEAVGKPARIRGIVTTAEGQALVGIRVAALAEMTVGGIDQWVEVDSALTGADGRYSVGKLDDGTYRVRFDDTSGTYSTEFYNDVPRADLAEDVVLVPGGGMRDLLPTELGGAAHLTGLVTGSTGAGIEGAEVTAYVVQDDAWIPFVTVSTGADGRYDVGGLPGGAYTLGFHDPATGVGEYWNDNAALGDADTLTVDSAGSTTGLDARLATPLPEPTPELTNDPTPTGTTAPADTTAAAGSTATPTTTATTTAAKVVMVKRPRVRGVAAVTQVLRVTRGAWNPTKVSRKIQWLANGKRIKGATKARLRVTKKLVGKRLSVRVVASAPQLTRLIVKTRTTKRVRA
jgi:5-hydroxyisourate hydrolase-like protein (transthyretin family)